MKKIFSIILISLLILPTVLAADPAAKIRKLKEKERKEILKKLKKENWKALDTSQGLELAFMQHWMNCDEPGSEEVIGYAFNCKNKQSGMMMAINNAYITYAQTAEQNIKGQISSEINTDGMNLDNEMDKFYSMYTREVEKGIKGEMKKSFTIYKDNGNGTMDVNAYFIVNEAKAEEAKKKALENALEENEELKKLISAE